MVYHLGIAEIYRPTIYDDFNRHVAKLKRFLERLTEKELGYTFYKHKTTIGMQIQKVSIINDSLTYG